MQVPSNSHLAGLLQGGVVKDKAVAVALLHHLDERLHM